MRLAFAHVRAPATKIGNVPRSDSRCRLADKALHGAAVLELDRKVGEAIDIYVNDRLVARGEVVLVEDRLGITMTEIIKAGSGS